MLGTIFKRGPIWCWDPLKIVVLELKRKILINKHYTWTNSGIGYKSSAHAPIVILLWTILQCSSPISTLALIRIWYFEGGGGFHNSVFSYIPSWNIEWTFPNKGVGGAFSEILKCHFQIEGPWGQLGKVTLRVKCSITMSINNNCTRRGSTITTVIFPNSNSKTNRLALRRIWYFERGSFLVHYIQSIRKTNICVLESLSSSVGVLHASYTKHHQFESWCCLLKFGHTLLFLFCAILCFTLFKAGTNDCALILIGMIVSYTCVGKQHL